MRELVAGFDAISLDELNEHAELLCRVDNKYIVDLETVGELVDALRDEFRVLEIDGRRVFTYETVYFDSPQLGAYRAHLQGRRRRFKVRSRRYVDSGLHVFEVKLKGRGGRTDKRRLRVAAEQHARLTPDAERFADGVLREAYGQGLPDGMEPALEMSYERITLTAREDGERVTFDFNLDYGDAALHDGYAIVETKTGNGRGIADRALIELGVRPESCSKYSVGIGLTREDVRTNPWSRLMRRYFSRSADWRAAHHDSAVVARTRT
jgi:hypothetical protein